MVNPSPVQGQVPKLDLALTFAMSKAAETGAPSGSDKGESPNLHKAPFPIIEKSSTQVVYLAFRSIFKASRGPACLLNPLILLEPAEGIEPTAC